MKLKCLITAVLATSAIAHAQSVQVVGTIPTVITPQHHGSRMLHESQTQQPKIVLLQKIKLSSAAKQTLTQKIKHAIHHPTQTFSADDASQHHVELGMGNVPVLDQGAHGSCVTFANGGAINAALNKGDYVSELCSLSLGKTLADQDPNYPDGWNGSWGPIVLNQMMDYGIVSKTYQHQNGCGGLKQYPGKDPNQTGNSMPISTYKSASESIKDRVTWKTIIKTEDAFQQDGPTPEEVLEQVKDSLRQGHRLTFGVLLDVNQGMNGAVGMYKGFFDTWMLTPAIEKDAQEGKIEAGHEMIITGFDDDATVTSIFDGTTNKGLLTLRNSWGSMAGDRGNYYMSYDHFKALALEVQKVHAAG